MSKQHWLDFTDPDYDAWIDKWNYTWPVFTGEYCDKGRIKRFLQRRADWEKDQTLLRRINSADPNLLLSTLVGSVTGQLVAVEGDAVRVTEAEGVNGLGSKDDPDSIMGRLWRNADRMGTNLPVLWRRYTTRQMVFQWMYVHVDGLLEEVEADESGAETRRVVADAAVNLIDPRMVMAKGQEHGRYTWMKVRHEVIEGGGDPKEPQEVVERWTVYTLDGWARYRKVKQGGEVIEEVEDEGQYEFYEDKARTLKRLPIFLVRLPFEVYLTHYAARKVVALFNLESQRDTYLGEGTTTHFVDESSPALAEEHRDDMEAGETFHNFDPGTKAYYIHPPEGPARLASETIDDKRKDLFVSMFQQYGNAAREVTATQIRQEARAGIESFLNLLSTSVDEAENQVLWLLEQIYFPDDPSKWGIARVERSTNFVPESMDAMVEMVMNTVFAGKEMPITPEIVYDAAKFVWTQQLGFGLEDEETLRAAADAYVTQRSGARPGLQQRVNQLVGAIPSPAGGDEV